MLFHSHVFQVYTIMVQQNQLQPFSKALLTVVPKVDKVVIGVSVKGLALYILHLAHLCITDFTCDLFSNLCHRKTYKSVMCFQMGVYNCQNDEEMW